MNEETKTKLLEEEVASQSKLIKLLVEFYDESPEHLYDPKQIKIVEKIEKDYDLNMFRKSKEIE